MHIQSSSSPIQSLAALREPLPSAAAAPALANPEELIQSIQRWAQLDPARAVTAQRLTTHLQTRPNARNLSLLSLQSADLPPELGRLQQLRRLDVSMALPQTRAAARTPIPPGTWDVIGELHQLTDLSLLTNTLAAPSWLTPANFPHLRTLGVRASSIAPHGNFAGVLGDFPQLRELTVNGTRTESAGALEGIATMRGLRQLNLRGVAPEALPACLNSDNFPLLHLVSLENGRWTEVPQQLIKLDAHVALTQIELPSTAGELARHQRARARLAGAVSGGLQLNAHSPLWRETTQISAAWEALMGPSQRDERLSAGMPPALECLMWQVNYHYERLIREGQTQPGSVPPSLDTQRSAAVARGLIDALNVFETMQADQRAEVFGDRFDDQHRVLQHLVAQVSATELADIATVYGDNWRDAMPSASVRQGRTNLETRALLSDWCKEQLNRRAQALNDRAIVNGHPQSEELQDLSRQLAALLLQVWAETEIAVWGAWDLPDFATLRQTMAEHVASEGPLDDATFSDLLSIFAIPSPPAVAEAAASADPSPAPVPRVAPPLTEMVETWRGAETWAAWLTSKFSSLCGQAPATPSPWPSIAAEPHADTFSLFLSDLTGTREYRSINTRELLRERVRELLDDIEASTTRGDVGSDIRKIGDDFRATCFSIAGANPSCDDRPTEKMNQLDLARLDYHASAGDLTPQELLNAGISAFRADTLRTVADTTVARLRQIPLAPGAPQVDELQVHLAYQVSLAQQLGLPFRANAMMYFNASDLTDQDLQDAADEVRARQSANHGEALLSFLAQWTPWQHHMERTHAAEFAPLNSARYERMEALGRAAQSAEDSIDEKSEIQLGLPPRMRAGLLAPLTNVQESIGEEKSETDEKSEARLDLGLAEFSTRLSALNSGQYMEGIGASEAQYRSEWAALMTRLTTAQINPTLPLFADNS